MLLNQSNWHSLCMFVEMEKEITELNIAGTMPESAGKTIRSVLCFKVNTPKYFQSCDMYCCFESGLCFNFKAKLLCRADFIEILSNQNRLCITLVNMTFFPDKPQHISMCIYSEISLVKISGICLQIVVHNIVSLPFWSEFL